MVRTNHSNKISQINCFRILTLFIQCFLILYKKYQIHRLFVLVSFLVSFAICFLYNISHQPKKSDDLSQTCPLTHIFYPNTSTYLSLSHTHNQSHRLVLLWSNLFDNIYWHQPSYFNSSTIISCSAIHQCVFTRNQQQLSQASVVAFHLYDMKRFELPERKLSTNVNQNWIFITGESPVNFYYQNPSYLPYILDDYFDRSISYKSDSSFPVFVPQIKRRNFSHYERDMNIQSLKLKKKPILWIVSNCVTFSQREEYVKQLNRYLPVDIYGRCGLSCMKDSNNRECSIDRNDYYFYLAFENSRCHSYITEKFWNIIADKTHRLVPIVMGAEENDYEQIAPHKSFIHVNQYKTAEELATYLNYLMKNPDKYLNYLQWREHTDVELLNPQRWKNLLCPLCQMAYETHLSPQINFSSWYNPKIDCHADDVELLSKCKQTTLNVLMSWIHNIKCP